MVRLTSCYHLQRLLAIIALAALLAACTPQTATFEPQPTEMLSSDAALSTPEAPQDDGSLAMEESSIVIVIPQDPAGFNGVAVDTGYEQLVSELVMLSVAEVDPEGNIFPELAAELPNLENGGVVIDASGVMTATWKLRSDVNWADGRPVTADDVLFTYSAISDPETGIWIEGLDLIETVDKVDDYTFYVRYSSIYPNYLTQFGGENIVIWPAHYCQQSQGFASWDCNRTPLSNGPYLLVEWVAGDHLTFVRNPGYFDDTKKLIERILVKVVPEQSVRKTMLIEGDADLHMWANEQMINDLVGYSNVGISYSPTSRWVMRLYPNLAAKGTIDPEASPHPVLSDVRVRQAIRKAIDVETIVREIWYDLPQQVWTEFFRSPYQCDVPRPVYDIVGAKALLEEAGWKDSDGDGTRECQGCTTAEPGTRMAIELMTYSEFGEELDLTQQLIAEMLGEIGIETELTRNEGTILWADYASGGLEQNGKFDLNLWDDGYQGVDPTDFLWFYYHSEASQPDNGWNIVRWKNPEMDALIDQAYTLDDDLRKELFCQMADLMEAELPNIPLFSIINADAYAVRLQGIKSNVNDVVTWNVADWTLAR